MRHSPERLFFVGLAVLVLGLAAIDSGLGGRERPILVLLIIAGVAILWLLTRPGSQPPNGWPENRADNDDPRD